MPIIALGEIEQALTRDDFRHADGKAQFLFCFANVDEKQAEVQTKQICERIRARLIEEFPERKGLLRVEPFVVEVERGAVLKSHLPPLAALIVSLEKIRDEQRKRSHSSGASLFRSARAMIQPAWSRRRSSSGLSRCLLEAPYGASLSDWPLNSDEQIMGNLADLDGILLAKAIAGLHANLRGRNRHVTLLVPVRYSTFEAADKREDYFALHQAIPDDYARQVCLEIQLAPAAHFPLNLSKTLASLQAPGLKLVLQIPDIEWRLIRGLHRVLWGVSAELRGTKYSLPLLEQKLKKMAETAEALGLVSIAVGADSMGLSRVAREAGFDFVIGTAIHPSRRVH